MGKVIYILMLHTYRVCKLRSSSMVPCLRFSVFNGHSQRCCLHYLSRSFSFHFYQSSSCILPFSPLILQFPFVRSFHSGNEMNLKFDDAMKMESFPCVAKHDYNDPSIPKTLSFQKGDNLIATHRNGSWWFGELDMDNTQTKDKVKTDKGWFPGDFVTVDRCQNHLGDEWTQHFEKIKNICDPALKEREDPSFKKKKEREKRIKVYTKTGDGGETYLFNAKRGSKTLDYFDALGDVDELNAQLGVCNEYIGDSFAPPKNCKVMIKQIHTIQRCLFDIGSAIATPKNSSSKKRLKLTKFEEDNVKHLEVWIDDMDQHLPPLKKFILPSGGHSSTSLHLARTKARRAERSVVPIFKRGDVDQVVQQYLNRLSDYLFVCARFIASKEDNEQMTYKKSHQKNVDIESTMH